MRLPVFFMALYLAALACFPCQDLAEVTSDQTGVASAYDQQDSPDHSDHCTALCVCACCGVLADTPPVSIAMVAALPLPPAGKTNPARIPGWKFIEAPVTHGQPPRA